MGRNHGNAASCARGAHRHPGVGLLPASVQAEVPAVLARVHEWHGLHAEQDADLVATVRTLRRVRVRCLHRGPGPHIHLRVGRRLGPPRPTAFHRLGLTEAVVFIYVCADEHLNQYSDYFPHASLEPFLTHRNGVVRLDVIIRYITPMAAKKSESDTTNELLKKILITQLTLARVPQGMTAKIVGISIGAVNAIAKHVKVPKE